MTTTQNRLGWKVEESDYGFIVVSKYGSQVDVGGFRRTYATAEDAQAAIDNEIAKRDRNNAKSRKYNRDMRDMGMVRTSGGSWE